MNWIILLIAGLFEVAFAACLGMAKASAGKLQLIWYVGFFIALTLSMLLLAKAIQTIPIGTAYAVWTGVGAIGTAILGIVIFKDQVTFWRIFFLITLIGSIIGLKAVAH